MKLNRFLKTGLILLICFVVFTIIGNLFFEIRRKGLYDFLIFFKDVVLILTFILLIIGFYKLRNNWKWFIIIPLLLFAVLIVVIGFLFEKMPNEITIKKDTEILYINKINPKEKVIRQGYWTGITGGSYHNDTIQIYKLNSSVRVIQKADINKIEKDTNWTKVVR